MTGVVAIISKIFDRNKITSTYILVQFLLFMKIDQTSIISERTSTIFFKLFTNITKTMKHNVF